MRDRATCRRDDVEELARLGPEAGDPLREHVGKR
jgi:hypothetical protein